ncbi:MAG: CoB--CoM heterodisulfide reductase iron-sulfur subunit B family protein [Candidatus Hodarchaeota archaeon]
MTILYYPGCTIKDTALNFETSAIAVAKALGIEMQEMKRWNCCGTVYSMATDDLMQQLAPIRDLVRVQEEGEDKVVVLCAMCYNTIAQANELVRLDSEKLEIINAFMDREEDYKCAVDVYHYLSLLIEHVGLDKITKSVKTPLKGLKIAPYYGCTTVRPKHVAIDDTEDPKIMGKVLEALGAEIINDPFKVECCGSYQTVNSKNAVAERTYNIVSSARGNGAEIIALTCPLCEFNIDNRQKETQELHPEFKKMPVLYFTQLMALALGLDEKTYGFEQHYVDPRPLLKEKGLLK